MFNFETQVLFVDFGFEETLSIKNLARFPREFKTLPFQSSRFKIKNVPEIKNFNEGLKVLQIMRNIIPVVMSVVV